MVGYASTSTTTSSTTREVLEDGTIIIKTVYHTVTTHSVAEIKNTLPVTSSVTERQLFTLIQNYRKEKKEATTLKYSSKLANVARGHAKYMSVNNVLSHMDDYGRTAGDRIASGGFELSFWGEIVGEAKDAEQVFKAFKNSKIHNDIILDDAYTIIGVGYYQGKYSVSFYKDKNLKYADKEAVVNPVLIRSKSKISATTNSS